jgi:hypothetical protein
MKTIKMTRTIRRELPNGWLVWIGPDGISFRPKRQPSSFFLTWKEIVDRGQFLSISRQLPGAVVDVKDMPKEQVDMFPVDDPVVPPEIGVHMTHCNMGEYVGVCKYGELDCPALETASMRTTDVDEALSTEGGV